MTEPTESVAELILAWEHVRLFAARTAALADHRNRCLHPDLLMVAVPNIFTRNQLEGRFRGSVEASLTGSSAAVQLAVIVDETLRPGGGRRGREQGKTRRRTLSWAPNDHDCSALGRTRPGRPPAPGRRGSADLGRGLPDRAVARSRPYRPRREPDTRLNPKYSFETFVIGASNRSRTPPPSPSPKPGQVVQPADHLRRIGLGKTHLLHALGHYVRSYFDRVRVRYVSTEELTNDFINAISQNRGAEFRRRYRDVDVLLIDDIQFLEGKEQTQEEFFHTFNTLHNAQKQIVMTSDRPPKLLENLEPRLRSRFGWGLITDVQPPDLETRIAILRKKAAQERLTAGPEVLEFIASRIQTNIRELEGALIRVTAFASLNRQQVDMSLAEIVLKDLIPEGGETQISTSMIMAQTAAYFDARHRRPLRPEPHPRAGHRPADRHVPGPRADRPVAAQDRPAFRRPRPHHRDARRPQDPDPDGRAAQRLQPGD